jgi:hypothetical protein
MHRVRGPQSLRVMQGLLQMAGKHPAVELEKAASVATHHGTWRLRDLKRLLEMPSNVMQMDFLETHPLICSFAEASPKTKNRRSSSLHLFCQCSSR